MRSACDCGIDRAWAAAAGCTTGLRCPSASRLRYSSIRGHWTASGDSPDAGAPVAAAGITGPTSALGGSTGEASSPARAPVDADPAPGEPPATGPEDVAPAATGLAAVAPAVGFRPAPGRPPTAAAGLIGFCGDAALARPAIHPPTAPATPPARAAPLRPIMMPRPALPRAAAAPVVLAAVICSEANCTNRITASGDSAASTTHTEPSRASLMS